MLLRIHLFGIGVLHSDFIDHLAQRGVLRDRQATEVNPAMARMDAGGEINWVALTKLTPPAFADELAAFYSCRRIQRGELSSDRFAGAALSQRFLKEGRLYPYADAQGAVTVAIAMPIDAETRRAIEIALGHKIALAVATSEDLDAALAMTQDSAAAVAAAPSDLGARS